MLKLAPAMLCAFWSAGVCAQDAPLTAAVFGFTFVDTSTEGAYSGVRDDETARIRMLDGELARWLTESGRYETVDIAPVADEADRYSNLADCNRCDAKLARTLGADVAVTGEVQKVSNLILNITVYLRDAESGDLLRGATADIRGNNDKSWSRGLSWIMRNRILKDAR